MELDACTGLKECWLELQAREDHIIVAERVPIQSDGHVGIVIVVGPAEDFNNDLVASKRETLEDNLSNQSLTANKNAESFMIVLKFGIQCEVTFFV